MPHVVGVRFRPAGRIYYYDAHVHPDLKTGDHVVVDTPRGKEIARVVIAPRQVEVNELPDEIKPLDRIATEDDLRSLLTFKKQEREALHRCQQKITGHQLPMKLVEAEYTYDGSRLTFYFYAEDRVDFRSLVRDLAATFHTRIELRQIGNRDHAKHLGGLGPCGKTLCCSSWLTDFGAVSIKMAKEQSLPLNPNKISGVCGRLMCCLAYENDQYVEARSAMPAVNEAVQTSDGLGRVQVVNVLRQTVDVLLESGAIVTVPVTETRRVGKSSQAYSHGGCSTGGGCCSSSKGHSSTHA